MKRNLTCIICPKGCSLTAEVNCDQVSVTGHGCSKGEAYATSECLHPVRTVTATVRVANRHNTMVSVKTEVPVAKERMMEVIALLRKHSVEAPLKIGDVVMPDVCGSRILVTKALD